MFTDPWRPQNNKGFLPVLCLFNRLRPTIGMSIQKYFSYWLKATHVSQGEVTTYHITKVLEVPVLQTAISLTK